MMQLLSIFGLGLIYAAYRINKNDIPGFDFKQLPGNLDELVQIAPCVVALVYNLFVFLFQIIPVRHGEINVHYQTPTVYILAVAYGVYRGLKYLYEGSKICENSSEE